MSKINQNTQPPSFSNVSVAPGGAFVPDQEFPHQIEHAMTHLKSSCRLMDMLSEPGSQFNIEIHVTTKKESARFSSNESNLIKVVINQIKESSLNQLQKYFS